MPTYAYACAECGHAFDIVQSFTDDSLSVCPECDGRLRKQFNAVGVVFKGSGFYRTDARSAGNGSAAGNGSGSPKETSTEGSGKEGAGKEGSGKDTSAPAAADSGSGSRAPSTPASASAPVSTAS